MTTTGAAKRHAPDPVFRLIIGVTISLSIVFLVLYLWVGVGAVIGETAWYVPMMHALTGFVAFSVMALALGRHRVLGDPVSYWIGLGFGSFGIFQVFIILSWPGLLPGGRGVIAALPGTSGWLAFLSLGALAAALHASVLLRGPDRPAGSGGSLRSASAWMLLVAGGAACVVAFEASLPPLVDAHGQFIPSFLPLWGLFALYAGGAVLLTRHYRRSGDTLTGYTAVAMVALAFVILTVLIGAKRYDIWYYLSRIVGVIGFIAVQFGLLSGYVRLFRREQEAARRLKDSEQRLSTAVEAGELGIWDLDLVSDVATRSTRHDEIWGYPEPQPEWGLAIAMRNVVPADRPIVSDAYERGIKTGTLSYENRIIWPDGSIHWIAAHGRFQYDSEGRPVRVVGVVADITGRKRGDEALRESEARFRQIADSMPHLVWTAEADGTVDYYNSRWQEYEGIHPDADGSWSWQMILAPEDREPTAEAWTHAVKTGTVYEAEHRVQMRDGSYRWHFSRGIPVRDASGAISKWYGSATDIHAMKTAEEEVRRSEEHYRRALRVSGLAAARVDTELRYRWIYNPHPDFDPAAVVGKRDDELLSPEDAAGIMAIKREVLETGRTVGRELSIDLSNGTRWYWMNAEPLYDESGTLVGMTTVSLDITRQKEIEQALRESKQLLESIIEGTPDLIAAQDTSHRYIAFNQAYRHAFLHIFGCDIEIGSNMGEMLAPLPDEQRRAIDLWVRALQGETVHLSSEFGDPERERRVFAMSFGPVRNADGRIIGAVEIAGDITERARAEEALRESRERLRQALDAARMAAWEYDPVTLEVTLSENAERVLELPRRHESSDDGYLLIHPDDVERHRALVTEAIATGGSYLSVYRHAHAETEIWLEEHGQAVLDDAGRTVRLVGVVQNITERRRMEDHLQHAKEQAEAANRAKSEFLAHMSHELRTPIGGIMGMTDVLTPKLGDPTQRGYLGLIRESAESLLAIIGDILDLSRIEAGQVEIEQVEFETRAMIGSVVNLLRVPAEAKGLELSLTVEESVPELIRADREKIAQILRNLVSNAVKYTECGSVRVLIGADRLSRGNCRLRLRVSDTGIGIPRESLGSIFGSFVRLRSSVTMRGVEGTGLGLTISKRLAEMMRGTLEVESTPGLGSAFSFSVDVAVIEAVPALPAPAASSGLDSLPPLRILLAEDNRINHMFLTMMLEKAGHAVTACENGAEAVRLLESGRERYDLVLMDVQMPVMDGMEATKRIRALEGRPSAVPIIALTAFAMIGDAERFRMAGMDGYVTKPVDWADLAREIAQRTGSS